MLSKLKKIICCSTKTPENASNIVDKIKNSQEWIDYIDSLIDSTNKISKSKFESTITGFIKHRQALNALAYCFIVILY